MGESHNPPFSASDWLVLVGNQGQAIRGTAGWVKTLPYCERKKEIGICSLMSNSHNSLPDECSFFRS